MNEKKGTFSWEEFEPWITAFLVVIGTAAILLNLNHKGFLYENALDAIKDFSGLGITAFVYIIARRLMGHRDIKDFYERFVDMLVDWAEKNRFLISTEIYSPDPEKHQARYRAFEMITDHSQFVEGITEAKANSNKGNFLSFPLKGEWKDDNCKLTFWLNKGAFQHKSKYYDSELKQPKFKEINDAIAKRIQIEFHDINIIIKQESSYKNIVINIAGVKKSKENMYRLIELVDYVKILYLAMS